MKTITFLLFLMLNIVLSQSKLKHLESCTEGGQCESGYCFNGKCFFKHNWGDNGSKCTSNYDCASYNCEDEICEQGYLENGALCSDSRECKVKSSCKNNVCFIKHGWSMLGQLCSQDNDCASMNCIVVCVVGKTELNGVCDHDDQCKSMWYTLTQTICKKNVCIKGSYF